MKILKAFFAFCFLTTFVFLFSQCAYDKKESISEIINTACYPDDVGKIFVTKCATEGCHNTQSKDAAAGLDLSSWDKLFNGSRQGAAVIPYSPEHSFLVNFINTYSDLGLSDPPTMPFNGTPLSHEEVQTVIDWINDGAPDCNGHRLTDNSDRKKFYITNQGCDLVSVWDADRKVIMKYIKVGVDPVLTESPHKVGISPDGKHWYVSFTGTNAKFFQKYRTSDDSLVGQADIGIGQWNTFAFTSDSKLAYIPDLSSASGNVAIVDCETMTLTTDFVNPFPSGCPAPHGSFITPDDHYLYLTKQNGTGLFKIDLTGPVPDGIDLPDFPPGTERPHEIAFSPDTTMYFVTCETGNDVLVFRASDDMLLKKIDVGVKPQEMAFSSSTPYLFVTCMVGNEVSIINYQDTILIETLSNPDVFKKPHGVAVDDFYKICYIVNTESDGEHHASACGGSKGNLVSIDLNTRKVIPGEKELSVFPYSIAIRK